MNPAQNEKVARFRALHERTSTFVLPNPWDVGGARMLAAQGFEALATTSAGLAFSKGKRDGEGSVTLDETLDHAACIVSATDLPVSADLEDGFGRDPAVVANTIRRALEIGLAGASIEDATYDSHAPLHERSLAVERIAAAAEAARSLPGGFVLTARSEGFIRGRPDFDETLERLIAFEAAGADVLFAPGLPDLGGIRTLCSTVGKPVNVVVGIGPAHHSLVELRDVGVKRISTGSSLMRASLTALWSAAEEIRERGTFTYTYGPQVRTVGDWSEML